MKPTRVISTSAVLTAGEPASFVFSIPKTTQGWRPISVKIHPAVLAMNGSAAPKTISVR